MGRLPKTRATALEDVVLSFCDDLNIYDIKTSNPGFKIANKVVQNGTHTHRSLQTFLENKKKTPDQSIKC